MKKIICYEGYFGVYKVSIKIIVLCVEKYFFL